MTEVGRVVVPEDQRGLGNVYGDFELLNAISALH